MYHARKNANDGKGDAVANQLEYKPVCTHMPVCKEQCSDTTFIWVRVTALCCVSACACAEVSCVATADQEEGCTPLSGAPGGAHGDRRDVK